MAPDDFFNGLLADNPPGRRRLVCRSKMVTTYGWRSFPNPGLPLCMVNRSDCTLRANLDFTAVLSPSNNEATWSIPINFLTGFDAMSNGMQSARSARQVS